MALRKNSIRSAGRVAILLVIARFCVGLAVGDEPEKWPALPEAPREAGGAVEVVRVLDAHRVEVRRGRETERVRLIGVLPRGGDDRAVALRFAENLLRGERVWLRQVRETAEQRSAVEPLAFVFRAPDGLCVNVELIRQGYAMHDAGLKYPYDESFIALEMRARAAGKGIWRVPEAAPVEAAEDGLAEVVEDRRVVGAWVYVSRTGDKYHRADCQHVRDSSRRIGVDVAKRERMTPCAQCDPPR